MAFRQITWTNDETLWDGTTANRCRIYQRPTTPSLRAFAGSTEIELGSTPTVGTDFVLTERWNGASSQWAFNNGSYITGNPGTANPGGLLLGAFGNGAAGWSNFRFYGGLSIGRSLSAGEIASCRTFFGALAGLSL